MNPTVLIKRYRIIRQLGSGATARVYLAEHRELRRMVALKVHAMNEERERCWKGEARFSLEARTLARLDHPNVVKIYDFGRTDKDHVFLAMEYINGPRLADLVRQSKVLAPRRAVCLMRQVCLALQAAHDQAVIHRDLKAANIMIDRDEEGGELVKVVDFGLVKPCPPREDPDEELSDDGQILGSPHTMAPEQLRGESMDHRVDIYAVGVLLFRVLTGVYPFDGPNNQSTMLSHLHDEIPTFSSLKLTRPIPRGLEGIVRRCLARDPDDRYPNALLLAEDLQKWLSSTEAPLPVARKARVGMVAAGMVVGALLVVGVLGAGGWLLTRGGEEVAEPAPVQEVVPAEVDPVEGDPVEGDPVEVIPVEEAPAPVPEELDPAVVGTTEPEPAPPPTRTPRRRTSSPPPRRPEPVAAAPPVPAEPEPAPEMAPVEAQPAEGTDEKPATQETDLPPGYLPVGY